MVIPEHRHPGTRHFQPLFAYEHLPLHLQAVSKPVHDTAQLMIDTLADGPELTEGLRKLWEAKNSFVVHAGFCQEQGL
jgi:hypothetical protein